MSSTYRENGKRRRIASCEECDDEDDMEMVMCDNCEKWLHYRCAGVGPEVIDVYWICHRCETKLISRNIGSISDALEVGKNRKLRLFTILLLLLSKSLYFYYDQATDIYLYSWL